MRFWARNWRFRAGNCKKFWAGNCNRFHDESYTNQCLWRPIGGNSFVSPAASTFPIIIHNSWKSKLLQIFALFWLFYSNRSPLHYHAPCTSSQANKRKKRDKQTKETTSNENYQSNKQTNATLKQTKTNTTNKHTANPTTARNKQTKNPAQLLSFWDEKSLRASKLASLKLCSATDQWE